MGGSYPHRYNDDFWPGLCNYLVFFRFMYIGEDGHMRIFCCGRAVTGIGHVVVYKPPPKKEKPKKRNVDAEKNDPVAI